MVEEVLNIEFGWCIVSLSRACGGSYCRLSRYRLAGEGAHDCLHSLQALQARQAMFRDALSAESFVSGGCMLGRKA